MKEEKLKLERFKGDENPFRVPEGYFEGSKRRILEVISEEASVKPVRKVSFRSSVYWLSGVAASLLIGFMLFQNLYLAPLQDNKLAQEIDWFVNYSGSDLNSGLLASYVENEGLEISDFFDETDDSEQSNLIEVSEIDETYIIEEMMKSENW